MTLTENALFESSEVRPVVRSLRTPPRRLHEFFERSVGRFPGSVAVQDDGELFTYAQVEQRANRLANHLRRAGVRPGARVGVLLSRSVSTYVTLLGIGKAGGTFVPIDPASPADRVDYIAEDAALDLLVTTADLAAPLTELPCRTLLLDKAAAQIAREPDQPPSSRSPFGSDVTVPAAGVGQDEAECYVIYTSGSSGRPKGVAVAQSSICNFITVATDVYDVRPTDRVYQGMTISFDFSIEEIWPTFAAGATLVVGPNDTRRLGAELADFLDSTGISVLYCVPTLLATISRDLPGIRSLMVGGEACPAGLVERWSRPGRRMLNTYGPTESTVTATWGELLPGRPVTIGRPMPTYSVFILDEDRTEVPPGEVGEICVGGPGVAIGYLNLPEKTADRFIAFRGRRIYRTGDLGRLDDAGEVVYMGRADDEVKIRGHRVDLGEIETILLDDSDVEAAVAAMMRVGVNDELVAFVTRRAQHPKGEDAALIRRLRETLRGRVPEYMVPGYLEVLPELPTMPSGKVDRKRLPEPTADRMVGNGDAVVPAVGPLEELVRDCWAEAFGVPPDKLSVTADFFTDLGGHSLLATTCVSLLRQNGVNAAVRDLYANPTVRTSAARLDVKATDRAEADASGARRKLSGLRPTRQLYSGAGVVQSAVLYAMLFVLTLPVGVIYTLNEGEISVAVLSSIALAATVVYLTLRWVIAPCVVGLLSIGLEPGRYPLWGPTHLRLWAMDLMLALAPLPVLSGSPLMVPYLRLLGCRIGPRAHIGTSLLSAPSLMRIGSDSSIGYGVAMRPWTVDDGWVVVEPILVQPRAFVGAGAVLQPGSVVGMGAVVAEQSLVVGGHDIPVGETWAGSPSGRVDDVDPVVAELGSRTPAPDWTAGQMRATVAGLALLEVVPLVALIPTLALVWGVLLATNEFTGLIAALFVGPVFVVSTCLLVWSLHTAVLRTTPLGVHPARSAIGVRKWLADKLLEMSLTYTNSLYATLYTVPWLRALGARVGKGSEVSTVAHLDPDLLTLDEHCFVADMASVGGATFRNGWVSFRRTHVHRRAFVGNAAIITPGTEMAEDSLIGVATVPPRGDIGAGTSWLGSPAMNLPARQESAEFADRFTYRPGKWRIAERLFIEFFRIGLPASLIAVAVYVYLQSMATMAAVGTPMWTTALVAPILAIITAILVVAAVAIAKWLIIGTYRPRVEPLWSRFVRRSELVTGLFEGAAVPALLYLLIGTPMLPPMLRLFGAKIGGRTWIGTTYLTEFDLVDIGDDAMIGRDVSLQTHLFEDRVMKMSTVRVGAGATVGDRAIVLYDSTVGADTVLEPLSLAMKGEQLPDRTRWRGIPAEVAA